MATPVRPPRSHGSRLFQPHLELLEDRLVLSASLNTLLTSPSGGHTSAAMVRKAADERTEYRGNRTADQTPDSGRSEYSTPRTASSGSKAGTAPATATARSGATLVDQALSSYVSRDSYEYAQPTTDTRAIDSALLALAGEAFQAASSSEHVPTIAAAPAPAVAGVTPVDRPVNANSTNAATGFVVHSNPVDLSGAGLSDTPAPIPLALTETEQVVERPRVESETPPTLDVEQSGPATAAQPVALLGGVVPVDLTALQRHVDRFFAALDQLTAKVVSQPWLLRLAPWLMAIGMAVAAGEFVRRHFRKQQPLLRVLFANRRLP